MQTPMCARSTRARFAPLLLAAAVLLLANNALAQNVASLNCIPSVVSGGSGVSSTCTVQLAAPAAAGGTVVTIRSSNVEVAASVPNVKVPAGQAAASFLVATNARYRLYSGLPFNAVISAATANTATATLVVTAPAPPADFSSGVGPGDPNQWQGNICGRIGPIGGNAEILYRCTPASGSQSGNCTFAQECPIGCRRVPPLSVTFNDFCATSGPNPVALTRNHAIGGARVRSAILTEPFVGPTEGFPGAISNQGIAGGIDGISVNASYFPQDGVAIPRGSNKGPFDVATSYVPSTTFIDVVGEWIASTSSTVVTEGRTGHVWLAITPPNPPPALPLPTLGEFKITGDNPVVGGQGSIGQINISGVSSGGGPTIQLTSSDPNLVTVPALVTLPASNQLGQQVLIATQQPAVDTPVTITASDGRYTFSAILTVLATKGPLLAALSVNPSSVVGGETSTGTVTLSASAPAGGAIVTLSTPLPNVAVLPATVTVPAGAASASFSIMTTPVGETFSVNVFADLDGTERQALLTVTPRPLVKTPTQPMVARQR